MSLNYEDLARFVRKRGKVDIKPGKGAKVILLKSGKLDAHALIEAKTTRFIHKGKSYTSADFEKLVRASGAAE